MSPVASLLLPGSDGNYMTTPDAPANSPSGDFDIRFKIAPHEWTPSINNHLAVKAADDGTAISYVIRLGSAGLRASFGVAWGSVYTTPQVDTGFVDGATGWVRVTRVASTGAWEMFKSVDGASWTTIGSGTLTSGPLWDGGWAGGGPFPPGAGYSSQLQIGANSGLAALTGKLYYFELRDGIGGSVVQSFDPTGVTKLGVRDPDTVAAGGPWTIVGSAWDWEEIVLPGGWGAGQVRMGLN